jgi:phosphoribosylformylglycinamidine cyclo-ligase
MFDIADRSVTDPAWDDAHAPTVGDELLVPSVIYAPAIRSLIEAVDVHAVAHITGGGLPGNLNRVLGSHSDALVDPTSWEWPRIFSELQQIGSVSDDEMRKVFNLGVGMVAAVPPSQVDAVQTAATAAGVPTWIVGECRRGARAVRFAD